MHSGEPQSILVSGGGRACNCERALLCAHVRAQHVSHAQQQELQFLLICCLTLSIKMADEK